MNINYDKPQSSEKLWTHDFSLIWLGQLVSTLGDAAYSIALGFWVLQVTGSTTLMGTLMAASALPGVLISPFAGVWIDRLNKKPLLIAMDIARGMCMILIAAAAYTHIIQIWMVFAVGILLSVCGAVFRPGINASVPILVPRSKLSNANSLLALVSSGANMLGSAAGGYLLQLFGAPLLFLFNGLSYFFSGGSVSFIKLPNRQAEKRTKFRADMKDGFRYIRENAGLRYLLLIIAVCNFFSFIAIVLFLPLFQKTSFLGSGKYGVAMACFMAGSMAGFLLFSVVHIPARLQFPLFILSILLSNLCFVFGVNQQIFAVMLPFIFTGGFFNSVINVIQMTVIQTSTPDEKRGKVLAFVSMTTQSLSPIAMALGGILAGFFPIRVIISFSFLIPVFLSLPFAFLKPLRQYIGSKKAELPEHANS